MVRGPAVSVVVPAFNSADTLAGAVAALRASTFQDFELILVDDGSDDATPAVVAGLRPDVHLRSPANLGPAAARNRGAAAARAPVLFFTDADVRVAPDTLARVAEAFRDPELRCLVGLYSLAHPHANLASLYKNAWIHHSYAAAPDQIDWFFTAVGAVRADVFRHYSGFAVRYRRERGGSDVEFGQRLVADGVPIRLDRSLQVTHHRRFTLRALLLNDFRRASGWTSMALGRSGGALRAARRGVANVGRAFAASALLAVALCAALPFALRGGVAAAAVLGGSAVYLGLNGAFLSFAWRAFGPFRCAGFAAVGFADHLACAAGMAAGVLATAEPPAEVMAPASSDRAP
jgi:glycosyltransferase involved in cell wall biosynthesis